jgi:branched-chain amino acid transport system permease protein
MNVAGQLLLLLLRPRRAALLVAAAALTLPWLPLPEYLLDQANQAGIAALVALGLVVLTGVGGMTSFAQAVFVGFGAYTTAWLTTVQGWSPLATLLPSLAVTAAGALLVGAITVRLSGHFLALGTLAWAVAFFYLFGSLPALGQHTGISGIPPVTLAGLSFAEPRRFYLLVWAAVVGCSLLTLNLLDSRPGRALRALRGGGAVARAFGVSVESAKLGLFVYAALLAGLAGWLLAHFQRSVSPSMFGVNEGVEYLLMAVLGGAGQVYGALLGAGVVVVLREQLQVYLPLWLGQTGNFETVVFGAILLAVLLAAQEGLWPRLAALWPAAPMPVLPLAEPLPRRPLPRRGTPLLQALGLCKRFGGLVAVNEVSFGVQAAEIVALIGPNGAGKSTTFNLLTGVLGFSSGSLQVGGGSGSQRSAITPQQAAGLRIARTFQHVRLVGAMSVLDNVALGAHLRLRPGPLAAMLRLDRAAEARLLAEAARQIERVGLASVMHQRADSLALGQLRLVEIARALALDPVLLLLDEPAAGLRFQEKALLGQLLRQLSDEGVAVLIVEHDMDFVMNLVHRIVVLDFGRRIAEGEPARIAHDPAVLAAYLGTAEEVPA